MDTYEVTIKATIHVPNHDEALKAQQEMTNSLMNQMREIDYISKVTAKMKQK